MSDNHDTPVVGRALARQIIDEHLRKFGPLYHELKAMRDRRAELQARSAQVREYLRDLLATHPAIVGEEPDPDPDSIIAARLAESYYAMDDAERAFVDHISAELYFGTGEYIE